MQELQSKISNLEKNNNYSRELERETQGSVPKKDKPPNVVIRASILIFAILIALFFWVNFPTIIVITTNTKI